MSEMNERLEICFAPIMDKESSFERVEIEIDTKSILEPLNSESMRILWQ